MIRRKPILFLLVGLLFMALSLVACIIVDHFRSRAVGPINWDLRAMFAYDEWDPTSGLICGGAFCAGLLIFLGSGAALAFRGFRSLMKKRA